MSGSGSTLTSETYWMENTTAEFSSIRWCHTTLNHGSNEFGPGILVLEVTDYRRPGHEKLKLRLTPAPGIRMFFPS